MVTCSGTITIATASPVAKDAGHLQETSPYSNWTPGNIPTNDIDPDIGELGTLLSNINFRLHLK